MVAMRVLTASETQNMKMAKTLKIGNEQNKLLFLKKFNGDWNKAET